jgi:hypothetical protein
MNFVKNLKSTQLRELIIIFKSIPMKNWNIFGAWEGLHFEFGNLNGVWKFGGILLPGRAQQLVAQLVLTIHTSH